MQIATDRRSVLRGPLDLLDDALQPGDLEPGNRQFDVAAVTLLAVERAVGLGLAQLSLQDLKCRRGAVQEAYRAPFGSGFSFFGASGFLAASAICFLRASTCWVRSATCFVNAALSAADDSSEPWQLA